MFARRTCRGGGLLVAVVGLTAMAGCGQRTRPAGSAPPVTGDGDAAAAFATRTPIKHLVVVFGENISFDHYFGTYPRAENRPGERPFVAAPGTPVANTLVTPLDPTRGFAPVAGVDLLRANPNFTNTANGSDAANPFRLGPAEAATQDMNHSYTAEQLATNGGAMDLFPAFAGNPGPPPGATTAATRGLVMAFFDGNTVSAMWGYAQHFALNDNSWTSVFGPSTPGAINLVSGQTNGILAANVEPAALSTGNVVPDGNGDFTMIGDPQPLGDVCSGSGERVSMKGRNIGDLLNARGVSWGWFQGGFDLGITNENGSTGCGRWSAQTVANAVATSADYIPHHQPFQYYPSTANPEHRRPSSVASIGYSRQTDGVTPEPARHQYDSHDFFDALAAGNLAAVSYLKAPGFQDGHAGYSNPVDEQAFYDGVVKAVQRSRFWASTAIVLAYDDSDGWYDHQAPPIVNPSLGVADALNGPQQCTMGAQQTGPAPAQALAGREGQPALGRCGYGTRLPLLVISPYAKKNHIDHTLTDQTSILRFIETNWLGGEHIQPGGSFDTIAGPLDNMFQF